MGDVEMEWEGSELYVDAGVGAWPLAELELDANVDSEAVVMRDTLLSLLSLLKGICAALALGAELGTGGVGAGPTGGGVMEGCDGVSGNNNEREWTWTSPESTSSIPLFLSSSGSRASVEASSSVRSESKSDGDKKDE